jgi:hypothetical protein
MDLLGTGVTVEFAESGQHNNALSRHAAAVLAHSVYHVCRLLPFEV